MERRACFPQSIAVAPTKQLNITCVPGIMNHLIYSPCYFQAIIYGLQQGLDDQGPIARVLLSLVISSTLKPVLTTHSSHCSRWWLAGHGCMSGIRPDMVRHMWLTVHIHLRRSKTVKPYQVMSSRNDTQTDQAPELSQRDNVCEDECLINRHPQRRERSSSSIWGYSAETTQ